MWQIAAVWSVAATLGIYASGSLSGGHLNPAVTLSFATVRPGDFAVSQVLPYWLAQLLGGILGALTNFVIYHAAIGRFEKRLDLVRGMDNSIQSAAAFGDYWRDA